MIVKKTLISLGLALKIIYAAGAPLHDLGEKDAVSYTAKAEIHEADTARKAITPSSSWPFSIMSYAYNGMSSVYTYCSAFLSYMCSRESFFERQMRKDYLMVPVSNNSLKKMHEASTLLVSCIDFRLRDETDLLMGKVFGLTDKYDEVAIPGAALAFVQQKGSYKHWGKTLDDIIGLAHQLHDIEQVIFLDHRGCGAYKMLQGEDSISTLEKETETHKKIFAQARQVFAEKFPNLKIYTLLMGLDGKVEIFR